MLRQALLKQSRASISSTFSRSLPSPCPGPRSKLSRRSIQPLNFRPLSPRRFQRWQSTDADQKAEDSIPPSGESSPGEAKEEDPREKELEGKNREIIDLKDKYLRSVADFRNLQDRTARDVDAARQFAIQRFAKDLIESIDNLDRALETVPAEALTPAEDAESDVTPNKDLVNLHAGLKMTDSILMGTLKKHGLERFDPVDTGRKFDPRLDEATFMTKVEGKEDGDVFHTQSKGFTLNGRVLRAAKVGVVKNS